MENLKLTVNVTADDIREGTPCNASYCPVARAVNRAIQHAIPHTLLYALVGRYCLQLRWYESGDAAFRPANPDVTPWSRFVANYDNGVIERPFSFTLELVAVK